MTVYGVICQRWKPCYDGAPCYVELVLKANNIEVANRISQQTSGLAMKDIQKEFEDFWKSYKHFPIAGRYVWVNLCIIHFYQSLSIYTLYIQLFCVITKMSFIIVLCRKELHPIKPMSTDIWHVRY